MTTYLLGLTVEQQGDYVTKARAEAPAALEIAAIAEVARKNAEAWRAYRHANVASETKQETRDGK